MDHGRFAAFTGERIHVAGLDPNSRHSLLGTPADPLHIRSQKGIHAGDADHDSAGSFSLFFQRCAELFHCLRHLFEVASGDQIRLIHSQIEKTVLIPGHAADGRCISAAAAGGDDQHDRSGNSKACSFDAVPFRTGRVESQCCGRTVDQMCRGHQFRGDIPAPARR